VGTAQQKTAMMMNKHLYITITLLAITLSACTKQAWYQGAQSAKEAHCMKEPVSEYDDCIQQSAENYDEYNKNREALIEENTTTK
jgi:hypothetical protein